MSFPTSYENRVGHHYMGCDTNANVLFADLTKVTTDRVEETVYRVDQKAIKDEEEEGI